MPIRETPTRWGRHPAKYSYLEHSTKSSKLAVLFPGMAYPLDAPLMWYATRAAFDAGCDVLGVEYGYQANRAELDMDDLDYLIEETAGALNRMLSVQYSQMVFIGKSLGTVVQTEILRELSSPVRNHVFLTPLKRTIPGMLRSENALVVVGDGDGAFKAEDVGEIAGASNIKLAVIPGANHGLEVDNFRVSLDILKDVSVLCGDFCRDLH